jgi:hypothetical protein
MYYCLRWFSLFCGVRRSVSVGGWLVTECGWRRGVVWPARFGAEGIEANVDDRFFLLTGRSLVLSCCLDVKK